MMHMSACGLLSDAKVFELPGKSLLTFPTLACVIFYFAAANDLVGKTDADIRGVLGNFLEGNVKENMGARG